MFVDFKGYVDYFYLNDCVDGNYEKVNLWLGDDFFTDSNARPKTLDEYFAFIENELVFLDKRNERIRKAALERSL